MNGAGSATTLAAVAVLFKRANAAPYLCHLAGIAQPRAVLYASAAPCLALRAFGPFAHPLIWSPVGSARGGDHGGNE